MTGIYYTQMVDAARAAGVPVKENATTKGWQTRARSSGGFPAAPLGCWWHHTASDTTPEGDLEYMINGCDDAPVGNWLVDRDGFCWPIAAGASNCAGKGGPATFSRGTCPVDQGNTRGWQMELACDGVGGEFSQAQIDSAFLLSSVLNGLAGNLPADVITHALGAGDGYTDRKIDPATAGAVCGPWQPRSTNSSGTWSLADLRAECAERATPTPTPTPQEDDDVLHVITEGRGAAIVGPGYWHYARNPDQAYLWVKLYGQPRVLDSTYDYDTLMRTMALEPDDDSELGPGA